MSVYRRRGETQQTKTYSSPSPYGHSPLESGRAVINSSTRRRGWRWRFTDGGEKQNTKCGDHAVTTFLLIVYHLCGRASPPLQVYQNFFLLLNVNFLTVLDVDTILGLEYATTAEVEDHTLAILGIYLIDSSCTILVLLTYKTYAY